MALHEFSLDPWDQAELLAWLDREGGPVATPRPASTVLLLRNRGEVPGPSAVEVFLIRRRSTMAFAGGMHAFPGGGVDPRDSAADVPWVGPDARQWGEQLHCPAELATALVCAAARELFEECGVLLAGNGPDDVVDDVSGADWEQDRLALLDRSLAMTDLLARRNLWLRSDLLRPWAHWTTPMFEPRRYDTWFFVAELPVGQRTRDVGGEADMVRWIAVDEMLAEYHAGRLPMYEPTFVTVSDIVAAVRNSPGHGSGVEAVMSAPRSVRRVLPWLIRKADGQAVIVADLDDRGGGRPGPDALTDAVGLP